MHQISEIGLPNFSRTARTDEAERLARTQNVKYRSIGVDKAGLDAQVAEKKAYAADQKDVQKKYDDLSQMIDNKLVLGDQEKSRIKREIHKEYTEFWKTQQTPEKGLEWDLNKPESQKQVIPTRMGDNDPRLGPSSCQKFVGEDLQAGDRKKLQMAQQAAWCDQQVAEKRAQMDADKEEDKNYDALVMAQTEHQRRVDMCEKNSRRTLQRQIAVDNKETANQNDAKRQQAVIDETSANEAEQYNTFHSLLLSEHPMQAVSCSEPLTRKRKDHYKGMLPEEKQEVLDFQSKQREELAGKKLEEQNERRAHAEYNDELAKLLLAKQSEIDKFKAEERKQVQLTLLKQKEEKEKRDASINELYANKASDSYFNQFSQSHR